MSDESLFDEARRRSLDERAAFLDANCPDPDLRSQVEGLLRAHDAAGGVLDNPAHTGAFNANPEANETLTAGTEQAGERFGSYKLLQKLGEGGMGTVWAAEQSEPVRRRVALKLIKAGMDSTQVLRRFEAERQALALMEHPNIAKVLDAGATPQGRPYFAMELIKGIPITKYCDQEHLTPGDRLQLFIPVCQAVQHAHQKGVIHRDLKPSNVLIALYDGRPVPKVIDFGVAKATSQKLTERTMYTEVGQIVGTLEYMAPEQAELNNLDIDTRADIYSLGVILYELLAGSPPFTAQQLRGAAFTEMLRMIREVEPPKPSTRLSSSAELPSIAANRKLEPGRLTRQVHGDLDWIVMKALEKDRGRRYDTPGNFAEDIERYLHHEAILARPPSAVYKLRKFAHRNRAVVLTAAAMAAALLAGTAVATWQAVVAIRATEEAQAAAAAERVATAAAEAERRRAVKAETDTLADYRASTDDAIEQLIGSKPDLGPHEKAYLENALKRWQAFAARQEDDEHSRAIRSEGHMHVAMLWSRLGRKEEARTEYLIARDIRKKLAEQFSTVPEHLFALAATHNNLGLLLVDLGNSAEARTELQAARKIQQTLVDHSPTHPAFLQALAAAHANLANLLAGTGERDQALVEDLAARDIKRSLVARFPNVPVYRRDLAATHMALGLLLQDLGKLEEARSEFEAASDLQRRLAEQFPAIPEYRMSLANTHNGLGSLFAKLGKSDEARASWVAARDLQKELSEQFPAVPEYRHFLATTHLNLGVFLATLGKTEEAGAEYRAALELLKKLTDQLPLVPAYQKELAITHTGLGALSKDAGRPADARMEYLAAREIQEKLVKEFPRSLSYQIDLGVTCRNFGILIRDDGKPAESLEWFDRAIQALQPVYEKDSRDVTAKLCLGSSYWGRALAFVALEKHAEGIKDWDRAIELSPPTEQAQHRAARASSRLLVGMVAEALAEVAELTKTPNATADQLYDFACFYAVASGKIPNQRQQYADRAMELLQKAVHAGYKNAAHLTKDPDLAALRDREDFKKLLAGLGRKP